MHSLSSLLIAPAAGGSLATLGAMWLASSPQTETLALGLLSLGILAAAALRYAVACCRRIVVAAARNSEKTSRT